MKNLLVLLFVFLLSCSTDNESISGCECEKQVYKHTLVSMDGVIPNWGYVHQYNEYDSSLNCDDETQDYIFMGNNFYYNVVCE